MVCAMAVVASSYRIAGCPYLDGPAGREFDSLVKHQRVGRLRWALIMILCCTAL